MPRLPRRHRPEAAAGGPVLARQLSELIDENADAVFHLAYGILHDRGLAEDVVQDTMIKAWQSIGTFRGDSSVRTWLLRIAHNTAISTLRRRRDQATAPEDIPDGPTSDEPSRRADGRDDLARVRAAMDDLDEISRSIVILREVDGLSYQQIGSALDVPVTTVKTRLLRARRTLQAAVSESTEENP